MITRFLDRFFPRRPDPLEPNLEFVELLRAKHQEREDRLRRDTALQRCSEAIDGALTAAHELERMVRTQAALNAQLRQRLDDMPIAKPTAYSRKPKLVK